MRNYYAEFLETKISGNMLGREVSKVSKDTFDTFGTPLYSIKSEIFIPYDIFSANNLSGQYVIRSIREKVNSLESEGAKVLLDMPTVAAYEAERALCTGAARHVAGQLDETSLNALIRTYIETHILRQKVSIEWKDKSVPLFYLTVYLDGKRIESYNCSEIQAWIIRGYWRYKHPEVEIRGVSL